MDGALEAHGFASDHECDQVVASFERCRQDHAVAAGDAFWDRRVLSITAFPDTENAARRILQRWRQHATALLSWVAGQTFFPDAILVVRWNGQEMPPHRDNCTVDGSPNLTPWREWAGVVYLNDGYEGGQLTFPELGTRYTPVKGALVLFPARQYHGVEAVASGSRRYTSALWFSRNSARVDPSYFRQF